MVTQEEFVREFNSMGSAIVRGVLEPDFILAAKRELEAAMQAEVRYHGNSTYKDYGMVLLCSLYGGSFWSLFDNPRLTGPFNAILGEGCTVYAYTSSSMPPNAVNYSGRIHV